MPNKVHSDSITSNQNGRSSTNQFEPNNTDHAQYSGRFLFKSIGQDMKSGQDEDSPNETQSDTITPNHNIISSPIEFEKNT